MRQSVAEQVVCPELDAGTGPRNWRLDRIQDVEITGRPGAKPEDFSLQAYADESFGIYQDDTDPGRWLRTVGAYPAAA